MITIYGSNQCPKTVKILGLCRERGICAEYRCFDKDLKNLWEFIVRRDRDPAFDEAKRHGRLGIPCIICENGFVFDGGKDPFDAEKTMAAIAANLDGYMHAAK